ncbi:hypothetical protein WJX77_011011 [Trebouxia sp. C0004]
MAFKVAVRARMPALYSSNLLLSFEVLAHLAIEFVSSPDSHSLKFSGPTVPMVKGKASGLGEGQRLAFLEHTARGRDSKAGCSNRHYTTSVHGASSSILYFRSWPSPPSPATSVGFLTLIDIWGAMW